MRFGIITYIIHQEYKENFYSYGPYIKEMDLWFRNVEEAVILAPRLKQKPAESDKAYKITPRFLEVPSLDFTGFEPSLKSIFRLPLVFYRMSKIFRKVDHIHLRCPGNISLLGCILQIFFPGKLKTVKYAGNWDPDAKQPWTYRLQKWILSNTFLTRNIQVLVYGDWPEQSDNIVPFFTASFSEEEKAEVPKKTFSGPFTFLFVGSLVEGKRPLEAVKLVEQLKVNKKLLDPETSISLEVYGEGPERKKLEKYVKENQLEEVVGFHGSRPLEEVKEAYSKAHFVILPSKSEGWPKAIAEGMFFGCIPIATLVSCVPWMLGGGSRGILISEESVSWSRVESGKWRGEIQDGFEQTVDRILRLLQDPEEMKRMSEAAKEWSQQYTLERFEEAIQEVLSQEKTMNKKQQSASTSTYR